MARFQRHLPKLWLKINGIKYGNKLTLDGWPVMFRFSGAQITIGDECTFRSHFMSNLLGLYQRTILVAKNGGEIRIGDHVGVSGCTIYAWDKIEIGSHCVIGANCKIMDNDFHPLDAEDRRLNNLAAMKTRPVKIGDDVFIGCNSLILKGTEIGDRCVVGAGSVVSGSFPSDCIIAGNPAKIIRTLEKK